MPTSNDSFEGFKPVNIPQSAAWDSEQARYSTWPAAPEQHFTAPWPLPRIPDGFPSRQSEVCAQWSFVTTAANEEGSRYCLQGRKFRML
jgi:hypothetical protein